MTQTKQTNVHRTVSLDTEIRWKSRRSFKEAVEGGRQDNQGYPES